MEQFIDFTLLFCSLYKMFVPIIYKNSLFMYMATKLLEQTFYINNNIIK